MTILQFLAGLGLLVLGGELLTRGAVAFAVALRTSPLVIGLLLVGFGTSTPELAASVQAALADAPGVAVGNVVGSNICNILLILGLAAAIRPIAADPKAFRRDGIALALATAVGVARIRRAPCGSARRMRKSWAWHRVVTRLSLPVPEQPRPRWRSPTGCSRDTSPCPTASGSITRTANAAVSRPMS